MREPASDATRPAILQRDFAPYGEFEKSSMPASVNV
jgi:hypothetical protein